MKKLFAALTAFICASAVFTGCGKTDDEEKSSGKQSAKSTEEELEEVIQELIDAGKNMDIEKIAKLGLPDELSETIIDMASDEIEELKKTAADELGENMETGELVSVKRTEDIDESYLSLFEKGCSAVMIIADYMKENNIDINDLNTMDEEELYSLITDESLEGTPMGDLIGILDSMENYDSIEEFAASEELDKIESRFDITDACFADVTLKTSDGETKTIELPFYNIKGEGWNSEMILYPTMIGYVKKSKQSAMNSSASTLQKAATSALMDMDTEGSDTSGTFIISSDESLNYNVSSSFDIDTFNSYTSEYFNDISKLNYFAVISDGVCVYAVCENSETPEYIGTYPIKKLPSEYDGEELKMQPMTTDDEKLTLQELYDLTVETIEKN